MSHVLYYSMVVIVRYYIMRFKGQRQPFSLLKVRMTYSIIFLFLFIISLFLFLLCFSSLHLYLHLHYLILRLVKKKDDHGKKGLTFIYVCIYIDNLSADEEDHSQIDIDHHSDKPVDHVIFVIHVSYIINICLLN